MNDSSSHNFDLILVGATGFTGELTARFLESQKTERWAIAGRNKAKLEAVRDKLSPSAEMIVADTSDFSSAKDLVHQGKVILSTAGPFAKIGTPLVRACVELGRDYVDITGEVHWMRNMIDQYHESAQSTGSRIVHTCGFDSVPSDLGVMLLKEALLEDSESQDEPVEILGLVTRLPRWVKRRHHREHEGSAQRSQRPRRRPSSRKPIRIEPQPRPIFKNAPRSIFSKI